MNPLAIRADNLRSFPSLEFEIPEGVCAVTGPNGAGKSTLLGAIELALFADGARDLAPALGPWGERMEIELKFEHDSRWFRVRRSYSAAGRGKATLDLEEFVEGECESLTKETAAATQQHLESLLGLSRSTFNASAFLAQGNSAAFPEASPAERKAILGAILDPRQLWPRLAERARNESKAAERSIAEDQARIADREAAAAQLPMLEEAREDASIAKAQTQHALDDAEESFAYAQAELAANEAAAERWRAAEAAVLAASQERARASSALSEAEQLAERLPGLREQISAAEAEAAQVPKLERLAEEQRTAALKAEAARREKQEAESAANRQRSLLAAANERNDALRREFNEAAEGFAHLEASTGEARCDRCQQILGEEARQVAIASLRAQARAVNERLISELKAAAEAEAELDRLLAAATAIKIAEAGEEDHRSALAQARTSAERLSGLQVLLRATEDHAGRIPALAEALERADSLLAQRAAESADTAALVQPEAQLRQTTESARAAQQARRAALDEAQAQLVRLEEQIRQAEEAQKEAKRLREQLATAQSRLDTLRLAERACGRDGIPALIAENAIPQLEAEANRILERLPTASGAVFRVELRTQRALKTDAAALRETLDIMVSDSQTQREFLSFSGGERFRVSFALRWALAKLLAGRRGAESRLLVIDEPDGLDAGGMDGLAALLAEEGETFSKVLLVSHNPLLASAFEQVVEVESDGEASRLRLPQPAAA